MTPGVKDLITFIVLVVIVGFGIFGISKVKQWHDASQAAEVQGRTLEATSGIIGDGTKADAERDATDTGLAKAREDFNRRYQEDKRNDPETAARAVRVVPQRVRDNFRARRLARERLGCAGSECQARSEEDESSER